jgi:peptidoglycan/xylan/chitin deacetylase (PgdA/CDA1 family)
MMLLDEKHYNTITFDDLCSALLNGTSLPPHPIILTFDDGYEDFYTNAFPVLSHFNMKATSFIITGKVGWQGYMRWDEIRRIQFTGLVQFESHTVNHLALDTLSSAQVRQELTDSKSRLEAELQQPVKYLAYPMGRFNSTVVSIAKDVGYKAAVTTEPGGLHTVGGLPTLSRVRVPGVVSLWDYALSIWSYR